MTDGYGTLTEKEKQTLRLIVRGHDAKSAARELGLSVHTVNERLRDARRKLAVSSSREAARRLFESEGGDPEFLADKQLGGAATPSVVRSGDRRAWHRRAWIVGGVLIMSLILAALALNSLSPVAKSPAAPLTAQVTPATRSAQAWLALVDQGRWDDSWNASGQQFRTAPNTNKAWAAIIATVRPPLGRVLSRAALSQEPLSKPPHEYLILKFRTSFANKSQAVETVSLEREGQVWKVVGYWIA